MVFTTKSSLCILVNSGGVNKCDECDLRRGLSKENRIEDYCYQAWLLSGRCERRHYFKKLEEVEDD